VIEADFGEQILKTEASFGRLPATSLIFVDDLHTVLGPVQQCGAMNQGVLPIRGFAIFQHLLRRRLPNIDDSLSWRCQSVALDPLETGGTEVLTGSDMVHLLVARADVAGTTVPVVITPTC
jgi:hypothetical protein